MKLQIIKAARRVNAVLWASVALMFFPVVVACDAIEGVNNGVNRKSYGLGGILSHALDVIKAGRSV